MAEPEDRRTNAGHFGEHLDEGVVHAWLDGQLSAAEVARLESHIAACADCAAMVADARGFMAASSRILTALDGVPARVVPRSRPRSRIWQVRAAAAVFVVALGAAAVLSDAGGRFTLSRHESGVPQSPAAASPMPGPAKGADTIAAMPAAPAAPPVPSRALAKTRAAVSAPAPSQLQSHQPSSQQRQEYKKQTAFNERDASAQTGTTAQTMAPVRQDTPAAPASVMRSAFAAKAAPSAVGGNAMARVFADSSAPAAVARTFSGRRLASNAAYRRCAGKVVSVSEPGTGAGATHLTAVRLDSAAQSPPIRGFVVGTPGARANLDGWWVPVGIDSAVVSLATPATVSGASAGDSAAADTTSAIPAVVTRVSCASP